MGGFMRFNYLLSLALVFLTLCSVSFASTNLVVNGGAETGDFTGWSTSPSWVILDDGLEGNHSFGVYAFNTGDRTKSQTIDLTT